MCKQTTVLLSIGAAMAIYAFSVTGPTDPQLALAGGGERESCIEGTWAVQGPDGRFFRETLTLGRNGQTLHFALNSPLQGDATVGGTFPNATFESTGPGRGSGVRVGPRSFAFSILSWAIHPVDGVNEVAYTEILDGIVSFPDCDTQEFDMTASYYSADQDTDGDGIPDECEEPFLVVPGLTGGGTRFAP